MAARLGYDGVEVMVGIDDVSADVTAIKALSSFHEIPVVSVHAPCLLVTQRVWGSDPWGKLRRSAEMAHEVGAELIVVHPPFRWQREYARGFVEGIRDLEQEYDIAYGVENMYPWRTGKREFQAYAPGWNPLDETYDHVTVDLSHSSTAGQDPLAMVHDLGDRLAHVHIGDGSGSVKDEHLIPGRGNQPCAEFLSLVGESDFSGEVVVEINTRKAKDQNERERDLVEALDFTRLHLSS